MENTVKQDRVLTEQEFAEAELKTKLKDNEEIIHMTLQMRKIQDDVLNRYFSNPDVIKMNFLEHIKAHTNEIHSKAEFKEWLDSERERMKAKGEKFTRIERIEYRMLNKVYKDIIENQGEEFGFGKDLVYQYDDKEIKVDPIEFGEE